MIDPVEFYYNNRVCPECGGHQKNCEHFWAGHSVGLTLGRMDERSRTIELLESGEHVWQVEFNKRFFGPAWKQKCRCGFYGVFNDHLAALIKGEK